jgi:hypothetical protein
VIVGLWERRGEMERWRMEYIGIRCGMKDEPLPYLPLLIIFPYLTAHHLQTSSTHPKKPQSNLRHQTPYPKSHPNRTSNLHLTKNTQNPNSKCENLSTCNNTYLYPYLVDGNTAT